LKILQVGSSLPGSGGIEKSVLHNACGLRERGHEVHITARPDTWLWQRAQENGFPTLSVTVRHHQDVAALRPYLRLLRAGGYDIVNTHFSPDYLVAALAARLARQRGIVMTRYVVKPWRGYRRWLYGAALYAHILTVSEAVRRALLSGGIPADRVTTVHGGVETRRKELVPARLREELGIPEETALIGIVSRIAPEKGHRYLLEAMRDVTAAAVCLVVGDGPDRAAMREYVCAHGLEAHVRFLGWRADSEAVIAALDVVVQPSLWEEACSLAIMEAMSLARPVVATRVGGNVELIAPDETGILVPKADAPALADALNALARDAGLRRRMGAAARERQIAGFSVQTMAASTEKVYSEILRREQ
jgi:glycosyltransferase involved in cell wall biosynthesis